jgi:hypothetical protein
MEYYQGSITEIEYETRYDYLLTSFRNNLIEFERLVKTKFNSEQLWGSDIQFLIKQDNYKMKTLKLSFEDTNFSIPILNPEFEKIIKKSFNQTETDFIIHLVFSVTARIVKSTVTQLCKHLLSKMERSEDLENRPFEVKRIVGTVPDNFRKKLHRLLNSQDIKDYMESKVDFIKKEFLNSFFTSSSLTTFDNEDNVMQSYEVTDSVLDSTIITNSFVSKFKNGKSKKNKKRLFSSWLGCNAEYSQSYSQQICADDNIETSSDLLNAVNSGSGDNI